MKKFTFFLIILTGTAVFSPAQAGNTDAFRQEGIASWYGSEFDGKPTASGEIFNSAYFTAAHPNLPFGTILTVTNKQNNRKVTVRVNDRGPFVSARIVDLSRAAAEVLDMINTGTAPVLLEQTADITLNPAKTAEAPEWPAEQEPVQSAAVSAGSEDQSPAASFTEMPEVPTIVPVAAPAEVPVQAAYFSAPPAAIIGKMPSADSLKLYRLQVGAYKVPRYATEAFEKLKKAGLNPRYEQNGEFYRVVLAGVKPGEISAITQTLGNAGFREALIREETELYTISR